MQSPLFMLKLIITACRHPNFARPSTEIQQKKKGKQKIGILDQKIKLAIYMAELGSLGKAFTSL